MSLKVGDLVSYHHDNFPEAEGSIGIVEALVNASIKPMVVIAWVMTTDYFMRSFNHTNFDVTLLTKLMLDTVPDPVLDSPPCPSNSAVKVNGSAVSAD